VKRVLLAVLLSIGWTMASAQSIPVILRVVAADQHDTLGYNLVKNLVSEVYPLILNQRVRLWDGPEKEIQITATSLRQIEITSGTSFLEQEIIFIYENWNKTRQGIQTQTIGFRFSARNQRDEEVNFGFIEHAELAQYFQKNPMKMNANGSYGTTLIYVLMKKEFAFHLVQFGNQIVTTVGQSRQILNNFMGRLTFNPAVTKEEVHQKRIEYVIEPEKTVIDSTQKAANDLLAAVENYLRNNEEVFFNMGGDKIISHIKKGNIRVTRIQAIEFWKKFRGQITTETQSLTIFVNDSALQPLNFNDFLLMGIECNNQSMYEIFNEKTFAYTLRKINEQAIIRRESHLYLKALRTYEWNKLSEFVRYY
jgi:hypothetical protein